MNKIIEKLKSILCIIACEDLSDCARFLGEDEKKGHRYFTNNSLNAGDWHSDKTKKGYTNTRITALHSSLISYIYKYM